MKKRKRHWLTALLIAVLAAIYCNSDVETEDWVISSPKLPAAFDGLRITLLTDLHGREFGPGNETLLDKVSAQKPDIICISGDLADEETDRTILKPLLTGLCQTAPTYYVTGNHEWRRDDTEDLLKEIASYGVTVLRNDYVTLENQGETLVFAGAEDPNGYWDMEKPGELMPRIRQEVGGDPFVVMAYHRNDALDLWSSLQADAVLSGHGHGGVIRLPFVGGLLGVDRRLFPKNAEGLYGEGRTTMAVSRGLGGVRLWNRPHLPTIVLTQR